MMTASEAIKLFAISNQLVESDLDRVERELGVELGRGHVASLQADETYYPQLDTGIRAEAARMSQHYEIFYALEKSIRSLVVDALQGKHGETWWDLSTIPTTVKSSAEALLKREMDTGMTPRSGEKIDFTTFGELGEIIKANWDVFGDIFTSARAVERVMSSLNSLRGPIAHCSPLAEDEVVRLRLSVRDWFRLME